MNIVSVERLTKRHAEQTVLDEVTFGMDERDRVGLIGRNGSGKSTLLRAIAAAGGALGQTALDDPFPDAGRVVVSAQARLRYLAQEPSLDPEASALGAVLAGDSQAARAARQFEAAAAAVRARPDDDEAQERLDAALRAMDRDAGWDIEQRARSLLDRLGITAVEERTGARSGGQIKRIALARVLVDADAAAGPGTPLLLLDEPTNHLDVDVIDWLEGELARLHGGVVLVTHDRYLLDRVCTRIVEVHRGALSEHRGSYSSYLEARAEREAQAAAAERKRASRARVELDWLRRSPSARTTKAKDRVRRAEALQSELGDERPEEIVLDLPARRIGSKVVNLHNAGISFDGHTVLRGVEHKLAPGDRIGIVGPNGAGKTTLLRLVAGELEPDEGSVRIGETVVTGSFGQTPVDLPARMRVIDAVTEIVRETNTIEGITLSASQLLERFLFPPEQHRALVGQLSGGERRRLELLRTLATAPNLLLLDEPTNDLDLDTLGVLEEYLDRWPGTLVVSSHDRFFLDRVCSDLLSIEGTQLRHHPGGWSAYRERERERQEAARRAASKRKDTAPVSSPEGSGRRPGKLAYHEQREFDALAQRIPELEARRDELAHAAQAAGDDYAAASDAAAELSAVLEELAAAEDRWLELADRAE